jgi:chromosomal replication initiation ATPase DnaA
MEAVCLSYGIDREILLEPGKKQPGAEARAICAYLVQDEENLSLTKFGNILGRDVAALSRAEGCIRERARENSEVADKLIMAREELAGMTKCQA